ncbi:MAG: nitroreductase family protein [Selenomonadaceae bacterium]|nr:nitroreductase family protein [Selenomonadaceae bacterium]
MEFSEVINKRRTTRQFTNQPVEIEKIQRILDAGNKAPSFDHMRKWSFIVINDDAAKIKAIECIKVLSCNIEEPKNPFQEMVKIAFPKQRAMFEQAKIIILPIFKRDARIVDEESFGRRYMDFAEIWCVIENIFLATTNEGLACTMRIPTDKQPQEILKAVGCPEGYILPCMIGIGYAAPNAEFPTQIFPESNIHYNKW